MWPARNVERFWSDKIAATVMLDGKRDVGFDENVGERLLLVTGEPEQTAVNVRKLFVRKFPEKIEERTPSLAVLHDAILGVLLLGIFRCRLDDELAEPALDDKSGEIEIVPLLFAESDGILD